MDLDSAPSFGVNHQLISLPDLLPACSAFHLDRRAHAERLALWRAQGDLLLRSGPELLNERERQLCNHML